MKTVFLLLLTTALAITAGACSRSDEDTARRQAREAAQTVEKDAKKAKDPQLDETAHIVADEVQLIKADTRLAATVLPYAGKGKEAGDLYAVVQIVVPPRPGEREKALYKELAEASAHDPRAHFAD